MDLLTESANHSWKEQYRDGIEIRHMQMSARAQDGSQCYREVGKLILSDYMATCSISIEARSIYIHRYHHHNETTSWEHCFFGVLNHAFLFPNTLPRLMLLTPSRPLLCK